LKVTENIEKRKGGGGVEKYRGISTLIDLMV